MTRRSSNGKRLSGNKHPGFHCHLPQGLLDRIKEEAAYQCVSKRVIVEIAIKSYLDSLPIRTRQT